MHVAIISMFHIYYLNTTVLKEAVMFAERV
jgi:hypothetical protein